MILFLYSIGLLSEAKMNVIEELPIEQLVVRLVLSSRIEMVVLILFISGWSCSVFGWQVTNSIPQKQHADGCSKLVILDVAPTIAESIRRTHNGESISLLFGDWAEGAGVF